MLTDQQPWQIPVLPIVLSSRDVHVWRLTTALPVVFVSHLKKILSQAEIERAERFYFQKDRDRYLITHGALRAILGQYLNENPQDLTFTYDHHGKPYLENYSPGLFFNLSHSRDLALICVTMKRAVGIDIEYEREEIEIEQIAAQFYSPYENKLLLSLPLPERRAAFFTGWTRKEAFLKALGNGITLPLDQFDVSLIPGEPPRLLKVAWAPEETNNWSLQDILPGAGYSAALAVQGKDYEVSCWEWSPELMFVEA